MSRMPSLYEMYLIVLIVFSVIIIVSNLAIIGCVLFSKSLRRILRHQMIVSISFVDLLLGSFILPMMIRRLVESEAPTCHLNAVLQAIGDHGVFFICGWSLVTLDLIFLVNITIPVQECAKIRIPACIKNALICSWPWLLALTFLVPLIISYEPAEPIHKYHWKDPMCLMDFPRSILILLNALSLYLPYFFCALILAVLIVHFIKRELSAIPAASEEPRLVTAEQENPPARSYIEETIAFRTDHPLSVCLPNLVYFLCYTPAAINSFLAVDSHQDIPSHAQVSMLVLVPMLTRSVAVPFSWLALSTVRYEAFGWLGHLWNAIAQCCCSKCTRVGAAPPRVSYTGLREIEGI